MELPKLIFTDIDGVWTDGGMYYDQTGNEWKKFNTSDSWGVLMCKRYGIMVAIITGEDTEIVNRRAKKLGIEHCYMGVKNKLDKAQEIINAKSLKWSEVAFIGDDLNDWTLLQKVGLAGCPNNAPNYIKDITHFKGKVNGGDGAFREFVEYILLQKFSMEDIIKKALE